MDYLRFISRKIQTQNSKNFCRFGIENKPKKWFLTFDPNVQNFKILHFSNQNFIANSMKNFWKFRFLRVRSPAESLNLVLKSSKIPSSLVIKNTIFLIHFRFPYRILIFVIFKELNLRSAMENSCCETFWKTKGKL